MTHRLTSAAVKLFSTIVFVFLISTAWSQNCPDSLGLTIVPVDVAKGENICVDMIVDNFDRIETLQFSMAWDPTVLMFDRSESNSLDISSSNFGLRDVNQGIIRFTWIDFDGMNGETLPDGSVLFRLCFKAVGEPGDSTAIVISDNPLPFEASNADLEDVCLKDRNEGNIINITLPTMLCVIASSCSTEGNDGTVKITVWGGQRPYTYSGIGQNGVLNNQGEMVVWNGLSPGSYTIQLSDNTGADTTIQIEVVNAPAIIIDSIRQINPSCDGSTPGSISIDLSGGEPPYSIVWSPINQYNTETVSGLEPGSYTVTVKDSLGCVATRVFELVAGDVDVDINVVSNASCVGVDNGEISINVNGGTSPYELSTTGNTFLPFAGNSINLRNQKAGSHTLYIRDAQGCVRPVSFFIPADKDLSATSNITDVQCPGQANGQLMITGLTDGNPQGPYSFLLEDEQNNIIVGGINQGSSYTSPGLRAGVYFFTLSDNDGCEYRDTFQVNDANELFINLIDQDTIESCSPGNDAYFEVSATGGTGTPYTYTWINQNVTGPILSNLAAGTYQVEVRDANGCLDTMEFEVTLAESPVITGFDSVSVSCNNINDGSLTVNYTSGSSSNINFLWSNGETSRTISSLSAGNYCVTVSDENGCEAIECAELKAPSNAIRIDSIVINEPACFGYKGGLTVFASGGQTPYTFSWSTGDVITGAPVYPGLDAGTYSVTVTDAGNCGQAIDTVQITQPKEIRLELLAVDTISCFGDCNGRAGVGLAGGPDSLTGYTVSWSNGESALISNGLPAVNFNLCAGMNFIVATNEQCGSDTLFFDIPEPDPLIIDLEATQVVTPSCFGLQDGEVIAVAKGGNPGNYQYRWLPSGTVGPQITGVGKDTLYLEITDRLGCVNVDSIIIQEPDSISAFIVPSGTSDVSCEGEANGRITIDWNGGNPGPANYTWSPSVSNDSIATDLVPGIYSVTIEDVNGCSKVFEYEISEPGPLVVEIPEPAPIACNGDRTLLTVSNVTGGNGAAYYFTINNGSRIDIGDGLNVLAGSYNISIFDRLGCRVDTSIVIDQPNPITVGIVQAPQITVNLGEMVEFTGFTQGDAQIVAIEWSPNAGELSNPDSLITKVTANRSETYTLTVTDENGCMASAEIRLIVDAIRKVFIPNAFTPNDDGLNDVFNISTGAGVEMIESFDVFNRWGDRVFGINSPVPPDDNFNFGWDGTFGGRKLDPGVFAYMISVRFVDGNVIRYQGDVTLLR